LPFLTRFTDSVALMNNTVTLEAILYAVAISDGVQQQWPCEPPLRATSKVDLTTELT